MLSIKQMENIMALILLIGTLLSAILVIVGGTMYLFEAGNETLQSEVLQASTMPVSTKQIWGFALSFSPLGIIELGLLLLVATQTIRVALCCWFYTMIKDYKFLMISLFILIMLVYSSFWRG